MQLIKTPKVAISKWNSSPWFTNVKPKIKISWVMTLNCSTAMSSYNRRVEVILSKGWTWKVLKTKPTAAAPSSCPGARNYSVKHLSKYYHHFRGNSYSLRLKLIKNAPVGHSVIYKLMVNHSSPVIEFLGTQQGLLSKSHTSAWLNGFGRSSQTVSVTS